MKLVGFTDGRIGPDRQELTGLSGKDIGIDLVAKHNDGYWIAIQCKCYDPLTKISKSHIDSFLGSIHNATVLSKDGSSRLMIGLIMLAARYPGLSIPVKNINLSENSQLRTSSCSR